jgi:hypothetical protein
VCDPHVCVTVHVPGAWTHVGIHGAAFQPCYTSYTASRCVLAEQRSIMLARMALGQHTQPDTGAATGKTCAAASTPWMPHQDRQQVVV